MASTSFRPLTALLLGAVLVAGCSTGSDPETGVAGSTATPSAPAPSATPEPPTADPTTPSATPTEDASPSAPDDPATVAPPDLSANQIDCEAVEEPCDYGDDAELDRMWDACAEGDGTACDRLYYDSAFDTRYEQFGNTCGDRGLTTPCPEQLDA